MLSNGQEEVATAETVYDALRLIRDPEKDATLEDLNVLQEDRIKVSRYDSRKWLVEVCFVPTVPHCSLATLIGLCLRVKLQQALPFPYKARILVAEGTHDAAQEVNKQINDKERVAAALENSNLNAIVKKCIAEE